MQRLRVNKDKDRSVADLRAARQKRSPAKSFDSSPAEQLERLAAARSDDERAQMALGLQQTHGNVYVQRLLGQSSTIVQREPADDAKTVWDTYQDINDVAGAVEQIAAGGPERASGVLDLGLKLIDKLPKPPHIEMILKFYEVHFALLKMVLGATTRNEKLKSQLQSIWWNTLDCMAALKRLSVSAESIPSLSTVLTDEVLTPTDSAVVERMARLYEKRVSAFDEALAVAVEKLEAMLQTFEDIQAKWGEDFENNPERGRLPYASEISLMVKDMMDTTTRVPAVLEKAQEARRVLARRLEGVSGYVQGVPRGE